MALVQFRQDPSLKCRRSHREFTQPTISFRGKFSLALEYKRSGEACSATTRGNRRQSVPFFIYVEQDASCRSDFG